MTHGIHDASDITLMPDEMTGIFSAGSFSTFKTAMLPQ
jgi:hypothetical protein